MANDGEEEEDYMNMTFVEPERPKTETSLQRRAREKKESEAKAKHPSKAEKEKMDQAAQEEALKASIGPSNKGYKMLEKLGYKGGALGKLDDQATKRVTEPIELSMKSDRGGVGMDALRKHKVREQYEGELKRQKAEEGDYRERVAREREEKRLEEHCRSAMKVAERFEDEEETQSQSRPLKSINVLWRGLEKQRRGNERRKRHQHDLQQSLSQRMTFDDPDENEEYHIAMGTIEEELEEEDDELEKFDSLAPEERLYKLLDFLRQNHRYCLWCKMRYPDTALEGCPGVMEEDHD